MALYVAWDLDNTLVDADGLHYVALNRALEPFGTIITPTEHFKIFKGLPTKRKLAMLVEWDRIAPENIPAIAAAKQAATLTAIAETIRPDQKILDLLSAMHRLGWAQCCCSNAVRDSVIAMLIESHLMPFMAFVLSNEDAQPKPDPDIYRKAASLFGIRPTEMVVVEDAAPGKQAALAAGCRLVEVTSPTDVNLGLLPWLYARAQDQGRPRPVAVRHVDPSAPTP